MARSLRQGADRILTTHTGSLPRPAHLLPLLSAGPGLAADDGERREKVAAAVRDAVRRQVKAGIDIVSDGEMSKPGFAHYIGNRLTGFQGEVASRPFAPSDLRDFPEVARNLFTQDGKELPRPLMPTNDGLISYVGWEPLNEDLRNLERATSDEPVVDAFMPAISPGSVAMLLGTTYFAEREIFLFALADALHAEYERIVEAGFVLQVDCPDLALGRHLEFADEPLAVFRDVIELHVAALNRALSGIEPDRVRVHVCWGNYPGPHHRDVPLRDILDLIYQVNASGLSIEGANPRHEYEWTVFAELPLPPDKVLIPGVIDTCSNYIEHPETVAQRIERYASVVGRERVIAGTDCGFSTMAGRSAVAPEVAYAKLATLAEGARIASSRLWGQA